MKTKILKSVLGIAAVAVLSMGLLSFETPKNTLEISAISTKKNPTFHKNITVNGVNHN